MTGLDRRPLAFLLLGAMALCAWEVCWAGACASTGAVPRPFPMPGAGAPARAGAAIRPPGPGNAPPPATGNPGRNASGRLDTYALTGTALALRGNTVSQTGATVPTASTAAASRSTSSEQHGLALPRDVKNQFGIGQPVSSGRDRGPET